MKLMMPKIRAPTLTATVTWTKTHIVRALAHIPALPITPNSPSKLHLYLTLRSDHQLV